MTAKKAIISNIVNFTQRDNMYFYKQKGKQILDLRGNLILSHNDSLVKGRIKSVAPAAIRNGSRIEDIPSMGVWRKLWATKAAIAFIWGASTALTAEDIKRGGM